VGCYANNSNLGGELAVTLLRRKDSERTGNEIGKVLREIEAIGKDTSASAAGIETALINNAGGIAQVFVSAGLAAGRALPIWMRDFGKSHRASHPPLSSASTTHAMSCLIA